jgi:hypothetical protein
MMVIRWGLRAASVVLAAALGVSAAGAATVELTSVTGTFRNSAWNVDYYRIGPTSRSSLPDDDKYGAQFIRGGDGGSELWWGSTHGNWETTSPLNATQQGQQSGYIFEGLSNFTTTQSAFTFGQFTHRNGAVWTSSATLDKVEFELAIVGKVEGESFSVAKKFFIDHNETINPAQTCAAGGTQPCQDSVNFGSSLAESLIFVVGNMQYTLTLEGLVTGLDGSIITSFFTPEYGQSSATFRARIDAQPINPTPPPPVIPLPAAGWLLIAGVGGLMVAARRKRSALPLPY